jgi:hypothetical protein
MFGGRFPHTFVHLHGTLEGTGAKVDENYGYSAKSATPAVLAGPVEAIVMVEKPKYLTTTNRHFTVPISDATYFRMREEVTRWRRPENLYRLDANNCIHFVGKMAELAGSRSIIPRR